MNKCCRYCLFVVAAIIAIDLVVTLSYLAMNSPTSCDCKTLSASDTKPDKAQVSTSISNEAEKTLGKVEKFFKELREKIPGFGGAEAKEVSREAAATPIITTTATMAPFKLSEMDMLNYKPNSHLPSDAEIQYQGSPRVRRTADLVTSDEDQLQHEVGSVKVLVKRSTSPGYNLCPSGIELYRYCFEEFTDPQHYKNIKCHNHNYGYFNRPKISCCRLELETLKDQCQLFSEDKFEMINWMSTENHDDWYRINTDYQWHNVEKLSEFITPYRDTINFTRWGLNFTDHIFNATTNDYRVFRSDGKVMCIHDLGYGQAQLQKCPINVERILLNLNNPIFHRTVLSPVLKSIVLPTWNEFIILMKGGYSNVLNEGGESDFSDY